MENPFEIINQRLERIEALLENIYRINSNSDVGIATTTIMNIKQLSAYLDLSLSALYKMTSNKDIPHAKREKKLYFDKKEIDAWVLENKIITSTEIEKMTSDYIQRKLPKFP